MMKERPRRDLLIWLLAVTHLTCVSPVHADVTNSISVSFDQSIRPLLGEFCFKCHSTEKHKGDLDLERFSSLREVKAHPNIWQGVVEQLANHEMPPKGKPQPTSTQR